MRSHRTGSWNALYRAGQGLAFIGAVFAPLVLTATPTHAATCGDFLAVASADGARVAVSSPGYLLVEQADSGAPSAQARVDSLGNSSAFSGYPYPGDNALSALALTPASGLYPLSVGSSYPTTPTATEAVGPIHLTATSEQRASTADANASGTSQDGTVIGRTAAAAKAACPANSGVVAVGDSDAQGLAFADGLLQIGRVHSVATAAVDASGTTKLESSLDVGAVTVAGKRVAVTDHGIEPIGNPTAAPDDPIADALAAAGLSVTYLKASTDADGHGVVAPGLSISITRQVVGSGPTTITYLFGRSYATARAAADVVSGGPPPVDLSHASGVPSTGGTDGPQQAAVAASTATAPVATPAVDAVLTRAVGLDAQLRVSSTSIYAVLAAAAMVVLVGGVLFRIFGERLEWI